ncbi:MAG: nicotinamide-nucleotide amidohydrolase family protein [Elusimicrobiota bacterium]
MFFKKKYKSNKVKTAFLVAVGSELLNFKVNQYSPVFSQKLKEIGIILKGEITTPDNLNEIKSAIKYAFNKTDMIIICGGLGPTFDDMTRQAISEITNKPLVFSHKIEFFLKSRYNISKLPENFLNQCYFIKGAKLIENHNGTAFGEILKWRKKIFIILPGPRREWEEMWEKKIKEFLKKEFNSGNLYTQRFKIADLKEMEVQNLVQDTINKYKEVNFTVLAGANICEFSIFSYNYLAYKKARKEIQEKLKNNIYGYGDETIEENLGKLLAKKKKTISLAESCTGGLTSSKITDISGSSAYYLGSINAYSNDIKHKLLKVNKKTLKKYGAVSKETAIEMAENAKKIFKSDYAISITGIAGPGGGTKNKPVGLVYFSVVSDKKIFVEKRFFKGDRKFIKQASANTALWLAYKMLK